MSYLLQEPTNFINIKLTDEGRRYLSLGQLTFDSVALSDREINYGFARDMYDICNNNIIAPKDNNPIFTNNYYGSASVALTGPNVGSARQIITAVTESRGIFTGITNNFIIDSNSNCLGINEIDFDSFIPSGGSIVQLNSGYIPSDGDLVYIPWQPIQNSGVTNNTSQILSGNSINGLWYRVFDASAYPDVELDRDIPNFSTGTSAAVVPTFFFPFNGVSLYYGSAATIDTKVWNMNIIRTSSELGTDSTISGYTTYGSVEYNGTKHYLGFSGETRAIGIIHYTNQYTGNTYSEQLVEKTVNVYLPTVMWHKTTSLQPGQANTVGLNLSDSAGITTYDGIAETSYRDLTDESENIVGRVYHKLKMLVIIDPELLTALTYKSNRSYTLPQLELATSVSPQSPLVASSTVTGFNSGYTYFVTYLTESDYSYSNGVSYGYPQSLHCGYINQIDGDVDSSGNKKFIKATFSSESFPYLRQSADMTGSSEVLTGGTGWNANKVHLLINSATTTSNPTINTVSPDTWKLISTGIGNGIFTGASTSTTITASELQGHTFIVSQEDYNSGTTYVLSGQYSAFTQNPDYASNRLTFGNESFLFGNISAAILATTFKTVITVYARNNEFNSTNNESWNSLLDSNVYITEVGVFKNVGGRDVLVGIGKPSYPITKNSSRFLVFQLEIDF